MAPEPVDGPIGRPQYPTSYDPTADQQSNIAPWATITQLYVLIMSERPDTLTTAADGWTALANHLSTAAHAVDHDYARARSGWDSEAGHLFDDFVDNTTGSLTDWHGVAVANAAALQQLASTIAGLQGTMIMLWQEFDTQVATFAQLHFADLGKKLINKTLEDYTNKTKQQVLDPLNKAYHAAFIATSAGGMFIGPTNGPSMADAMKALAKVRTPPAIAPPPGEPGAVPGAPANPAVPAMPPPPPRLPARVPAARGRSMPPPEYALLEPAPPTPAPVPLPPMPPMPPPALPPVPIDMATPPRLPDVPPPPVADIAAPAPPQSVSLTSQGFRSPAPVEAESVAAPEFPEPTGRPSTPDVPERLRGRAWAEESEVPRSTPRAPTPQLSGRGAQPRPPRPGQPRGEQPEAPPRRGGPALPGRNGKRRTDRDRPPPGPGDDDIPPNRLNARRDLLGIRDRKPRLRPGSAEIEEPVLRRAARLGGRLGTQPELADELPAIRPALSGRTAKPRTQPRADEPTDPSRIDFVGDSGLFATEPAGPAVIDRPDEPKPVTPERIALPKI